MCTHTHNYRQSSTIKNTPVTKWLVLRYQDHCSSVSLLRRKVIDHHIKNGMQHSHYALFREMLLFECILKEHLEVAPNEKPFTVPWNEEGSFSDQITKLSACIREWNILILKSCTDKNRKKNFTHRLWVFFWKYLLHILCCNCLSLHLFWFVLPL